MQVATAWLTTAPINHQVLETIFKECELDFGYTKQVTTCENKKKN